MFAKYATTLPKPPASRNYSKIGEPWGMLGNDTICDCVYAGMGHADMLWSFWGQRLNLPVVTADVLQAYSAVTGYNPSDPNSDQGGSLLDALKWWRKVGIRGQKIDSFMEITPADTTSMKLAIDLFGCAYVGVNLPDNVLPGHTVPTWTKTSLPPNPNNGHCVIVVRYTSASVYVVTWGQLLRASWPFMKKYCDEAYAALAPAWCPYKPSGFDYATLQADLAVL